MAVDHDDFKYLKLHELESLGVSTKEVSEAIERAFDTKVYPDEVLKVRVNEHGILSIFKDWDRFTEVVPADLASGNFNKVH